MGHDLNPAVFHIPLMEVDDDLRGMLLVDRQRTMTAIAMHLFLRTRPYLQFRRNSEELAFNEVVDGIIDAIQTVPERVLGDFAQDEAGPRAAATDFIARVVFQALTDAFETVHIEKHDGAG